MINHVTSNLLSYEETIKAYAAKGEKQGSYRSVSDN